MSTSINFTVFVIKYEEEFIIVTARKSYILKKVKALPCYSYLEEACNIEGLKIDSVDNIVKCLQDEDFNRRLSEHGFEIAIDDNCRITK